MNIPDVYDLWEQREAQQHRELMKRPICCDCNEPIQDEHFYMINGDEICIDCMDTYYKKRTEDYME